MTLINIFVAQLYANEPHLGSDLLSVKYAARWESQATVPSLFRLLPTFAPT